MVCFKKKISIKYWVRGWFAIAPSLDVVILYIILNKIPVPKRIDHRKLAETFGEGYRKYIREFEINKFYVISSILIFIITFKIFVSVDSNRSNKTLNLSVAPCILCCMLQQIVYLLLQYERKTIKVARQ